MKTVTLAMCEKCGRVIQITEDAVVMTGGTLCILKNDVQPGDVLVDGILTKGAAFHVWCLIDILKGDAVKMDVPAVPSKRKAGTFYDNE